MSRRGSYLSTLGGLLVAFGVVLIVVGYVNDGYDLGIGGIATLVLGWTLMLGSLVAQSNERRSLTARAELGNRLLAASNSYIRVGSPLFLGGLSLAWGVARLAVPHGSGPRFVVVELGLLSLSGLCVVTAVVNWSLWRRVKRTVRLDDERKRNNAGS